MRSWNSSTIRARNAQQLDGIQRAGVHLLDALRDDLARAARTNTAALPAVEGPETLPLALADRRIGRNQALWIEPARAPERLMVAADLLATRDRSDAADVAELGFEDLAQLPALKNDGVRRIGTQNAGLA